MDVVERFKSTTESAQMGAERHPLEDVPSFEEHIEQLSKKAETWREKAKKRGYYQDENGDWWKKDMDWDWEDDFGEQVPGFKLDVEYPELADIVEKYADEYGIGMSDGRSGLKMKIYERAAAFSKPNSETIGSMFATLSKISGPSETEDAVLSRDKKETEASLDKLNQYYHGLSREVKQEGAGRHVKSIAGAFIRDYSERLATDDFIGQLSRGASIAQSVKQYGYRLSDSIEAGVDGFAKNECDGDKFGEYLDFILDLLPDEEKITKYDDRLHVFTRYVKGHGLASNTINGFKNIVFPLLERDDPEVGSIKKGGNASGVNKYEYGIADYTEECLLSECSPRNIDRLNRIYHEIPTSDYYKFEQNRQDAARIQGTIISGRDFIHDERPGVHEILSTMEQYYDANSAEDRKQIQEKMTELDKKYPYARFLEKALDLDNYEKTIEGMSETYVSEELRGATDGSSSERAIDILRRLVRNTAPEEIKAPSTRYGELNRLLKDINPLINSETGEVGVSLSEVGPAITELNRILLENQKKQGIFPSTISVVAYLDKMASNVIRRLNKKDFSEIIYDPNFKEILRFSQLTSSTGYSEADFNSFYNKVCNTFSEAYGDDGVNSEKIRDGWRLIGQKITNNMSDLGKLYNSSPITKRYTGAVWSGNLSHELIGAFEKA